MADNNLSTLKQLRMLALREKAYTAGKIAELSETILGAIKELKEPADSAAGQAGGGAASTSL